MIIAFSTLAIISKGWHFRSYHWIRDKPNGWRFINGEAYTPSAALRVTKKGLYCWQYYEATSSYQRDRWCVLCVARGGWKLVGTTDIISEGGIIKSVERQRQEDFERAKQLIEEVDSCKYRIAPQFIIPTQKFCCFDTPNTIGKCKHVCNARAHGTHTHTHTTLPEHKEIILDLA